MRRPARATANGRGRKLRRRLREEHKGEWRQETYKELFHISKAG